MSEIRKVFEKDGVIYLGQVLSKQECVKATELLFEKEKNGDYIIDYMNFPKGSKGFRHDCFNYLTERVQSIIENILDIKLYPTYSYSRLYKKGEILWPHNDRPACEISISITLGFDGNDVWPFSFLNRDISSDFLKYFVNNNMSYKEQKYVLPTGLSEKKQRIDISIGDGILYKGRDVIHWRDEYVEGNWQAQVFFHYVDANGPYKEHKYDKINKGIKNGSGN